MTAPIPVSSSSNSGASATVTITLPAGLVDNQVLVVYFNVALASTVTVNSITGGSGGAWTNKYTVSNGTTLRAYCYTRLAVGSTDSSAVITFTLSASGRFAIAAEVWPVGTIIDQVATQTNASNTLENFPTVTPTNNGADYTIVGVVHLRGTTTNSVAITSTPGTNYTETVDRSTATAAVSQQAVETKYRHLTGGGGATQDPDDGTASLASSQVTATLAMRAPVNAFINIHHAEFDIPRLTNIVVHYAKIDLLDTTVTQYLIVHYAKMLLFGGANNINIHFARFFVTGQHQINLHYAVLQIGSQRKINVHHAALYLQATPQVRVLWVGFTTPGAPEAVTFRLKNGSWLPNQTFQLLNGTWV